MSAQYQRRRAGMGISSRFTLSLGLFSLVLAFGLGLFLFDSIKQIGLDIEKDTQIEMAAMTSRMQNQEAKRKTMEMQAHRSDSGTIVQVGTGTISLSSGDQQSKVLLASPGSQGGLAQEFFAPNQMSLKFSNKTLTLVALVFAGFVIAIVIFTIFTARLITSPLNEMIEGVLAISHGRLNRRIGGNNAVGELAHLATAVERMVADLLESEEQALDLKESKSEAEALRKVQRHLSPMDVPTQFGWSIDTLLLEAADSDLGDFVDAIYNQDTEMATLWVGEPAVKGLAGALIMSMARSYLRANLLAGNELPEAIDDANTALYRDLAQGMYCSIMAVQFHPESGHATLVSAGHQVPAVRYSSETKELRTLQPNGIALGFDSGPIFRNSLENMQIKLDNGDALFLFSPLAAKCKGVSGEELGNKGVYALAKIAIEQGLAAMHEKLLKFLGTHPHPDLGFLLIKKI